MLEATHSAYGFQRGNGGGKQVVLVSGQHSGIFRRSIFIFYLSWCIDFFAKEDTVLAEESRTQRRVWILNHDDKAKNKNQQLSDNLSPFSNLWSRMAGNNIERILSDKTDLPYGAEPYIRFPNTWLWFSNLVGMRRDCKAKNCTPASLQTFHKATSVQR